MFIVPKVVKVGTLGLVGGGLELSTFPRDEWLLPHRDPCKGHIYPWVPTDPYGT